MSKIPQNQAIGAPVALYTHAPYHVRADLEETHQRPSAHLGQLGEPGHLDTARSGVLTQMSAKALVEGAAVAANFNQLVRIADSTGIPIGAMAIGMTASIRETLDINHSRSAQNTLGA